MTETPACDLLIVGAGIIGLAHAAEAARRGLRVIVIDRDSRAVGASIRNFGHCCVTAQTGELLDLAHVARERWLSLSADAGFFSTAAGALAVAQSPAELAVLEELSASREPGEVELLSTDEVHAHEALGGTAIIGGARLRDDLRVDPREAAGKLAGWLATQPGVSFRWRTSYFGFADGVAETSRGSIRAERVIVCVGHDLDYLYPVLAEQHEVFRCGLQMALVADPGMPRLAPAILTGTSMLRYPAFTATAASAALRAEIAQGDPALIDIDANVMFTQRPDGTIIAGDSHKLDVTLDPFLEQATWDVLLDRISAVLGVGELRVLQRWQGIYASSPQHPYLIESPSDGVTAVSVTSGVGMTLSHGLAAKVLDQLGI